MNEKINVLVVEDSPVARELLVHILSSDPEIKVIGTANNGEEAITATKRLCPDVITMDIHMPKMDGYETTRRIMEIQPTPIVIVTASPSIKEVSMAMRIIEAGAVAAEQKPGGSGHTDYEADASRLIRTVKLMSRVKVIKRWARREMFKHEEKPRLLPEPRLVAIGASTGGPPVLRTILSGLPKNFPLPVLIVQHISPNFIDGFADWLGQTSSIPVHVATQYAQIIPGHAYLAPDGFQMKLDNYNRISLTGDEAMNGLRPSVSYLFNSVAKVYGRNAIGILLTGMGKDGANGLRLLKEMGAITIVQDMESCVVNGMPGEAMNLDAAIFVLSPEKIAPVVTGLVNKTLDWGVNV